MSNTETNTPTVALMGVSIDNLDQNETVHRVIDSIRNGNGGWLVTPNLDVLHRVNADIDIRDLVEEADVRVADGTPLLWAAKIKQTPLKERVAGSDLVWSVAREAAANSIPVVLLGGNVGAADRAADRLRDIIPGISVTAYCPPFGFEKDPAALRSIEDAVAASPNSIVLCGLGFPKQERLMSSLHQRFPRHWFLGVGASIDFIAGDFKRAPKWMQRVGLEWFFRLIQEPRRLFRRYLIDDTPFLFRLLAHSYRTRKK